jgi:hypothetical protein
MARNGIWQEASSDGLEEVHVERGANARCSFHTARNGMIRMGVAPATPKLPLDAFIQEPAALVFLTCSALESGMHTALIAWTCSALATHKATIA